MAITGLNIPIATLPALRPNVAEAVETTVLLLRWFDGAIDDERSLRTSLTSDFERLVDVNLGNGRLYVRLPAGITFAKLVEVANELAAEHGYDKLSTWPNFWVPGTEEESVTELELDGDEAGYTACIALFSNDSKYDPLLWFTGAPYDDMYPDAKGTPSQLQQFELKCTDMPDGTWLAFADGRDYLVWYIMDLIRDIERDKIALAKGAMRVPSLGRRSVDGDSRVGCVNSNDGQAKFDRDNGNANDGNGVGLVAR